VSAPAGIADFDPGLALRVLQRHRVEYVVIGALAAVAAGAPILTVDLDVTPSRRGENLIRLAEALRSLDARLRTASDPLGVELPIEADLLGSAETWTLLTRAGALDLMFLPAGTRGYEDLRRDARLQRIAGVDVLVASLLDVIRSKEAARRPKDLMALPVLRQTLEEIRRAEG